MSGEAQRVGIDSAFVFGHLADLAKDLAAVFVSGVGEDNDGTGCRTVGADHNVAELLDGFGTVSAIGRGRHVVEELVTSDNAIEPGEAGGFK